MNIAALFTGVFTGLGLLLAFESCPPLAIFVAAICIGGFLFWGVS